MPFMSVSCEGEALYGPGEFQVLVQGGIERWVSVNAVHILWHEASAVLCFATDITEHRMAEEALKESEERYRNLVELSPGGIFVHLDGEVQFANQAFTRMIGADTPDALRGVQASNFVHADYRRAAKDGTVFIKSEGKQAPLMEQKFLCLDGSVIEVEVTAFPFNYQGQAAVMVVTEDISRRKKAEAQMKESEERYRSIFENALEGIYQLSHDGRLMDANPAFAHMYGYASPLEMLREVDDMGRMYADKEDFSRVRKLLEAHGVVRGVEIEHLRKDEGRFHVSLNARAVKGPNDETLYYEGMAQDITEARKLEDQLRQALKMEAVGQLAGGVAHDFNNILTVITGFGALVRMALDRHQPVNADYVDQILAASDKAANLTRSLLAFSRKQQITLAPHNLNEVVASTGKLLKRLLTEDIECRILPASQELIVMADATQIDQILINLAANARDAMPQGGLLSLETGTTTLDDEFIKAHGYGSQGEYALLSVSDTGVGMQKAIQERIFEPFFTTKEVGKGTGLGLATVYGIVKQHNGFISVYSEPGEGTTFHIYFPLVDRETVTEAYSPDEIKGGVETVLVAEDNPDARLLIVETLKTHGYTTIEAKDGEDAVKVFRKNKNRIELVIMDVVMPKRNGKEAWEAIRRLRRDVAVIFVSGYTRDVVFDKGIEGEAVDFIPKPLSAKSLLHKVREVLDRTRPASVKSGL